MSIETTKLKRKFFISEEKPLFPGYIFVSSNLNNLTWRTVNSAYGISKVVLFGYKPSMISSNIINVSKLNLLTKNLILTKTLTKVTK